MPSDESAATPTAVVLGQLSRPTDAFRSALAATAEQLRGQLADAEHEAKAAAAGGDEGSDLGVFAAGRIDADRFAAVAARESVSLEPVVLERIRRAWETLKALLERGDGLFQVEVASGESLVHAVIRALSDIGRAFGASRVAELSRRGVYKEADHASWLERFGFDAWNARERSLAPPLIVHVDGVDVHAEGLAPFLDGGQKIVLVVKDGPTPPAPLVRLITPGVFVAQVRDGAGLERFGAWDGPGVAAIVSEPAAAFVHDPDAGPNAWDRLTLDFLPETWPTDSLGRLSAFQQSEPLRQLRTLVIRPVAAETAGAEVAEGPADPVDKLAAWLMDQADLSGLE